MSPKPALPNGIRSFRFKKDKWENKHKNYTQKLEKKGSFKLELPLALGNVWEMYHASTKNFQWLIKYGIENNLRLRAVGSGWSMSKVAACEGGLIDTKALNLHFNVTERFLEPNYKIKGGQAHDLLFAQCGNSVLEVNEKLEKESTPKRSLKASGASNGQTIVGAISTGTHGSAFKFGAVHDAVVGLHIVVGANRHVYLEKASNPVLAPAFADLLGAELIRDDNLFNAAVVSFGSFGFIHGVMIETEPIYHLKRRAERLPYNDALKKAMDELDLEDLNLPHLKNCMEDLYHFETIINPHEFEPNNAEKGIFLKTIIKQEYDPTAPPKTINNSGYTYGDDALGTIQSVIDTMDKVKLDIIPFLAKNLFKQAYRPADEESPRTIGELFSSSYVRGKAASAAMGLKAADTSKVFELLMELNRQKNFPGAFAMRFVKGTAALLGFTKFENTCILELDGVDSDRTRDFYRMVWKKLEEEGIPYTLHWGKFNFDLNAQQVRKMYGEDVVNQWIACRKTLLDEKTQKVFTNGFMKRCGLG